SGSTFRGRAGLDVRRLDVLRTEAEADHPRAHPSPQGRQEDDQLPRGPGEGERLSVRAEHAAVDEDLAGLDPADRHLPPLLYAAEVVLCDISLPEPGGEQVGRGHRVLDR